MDFRGKKVSERKDSLYSCGQNFKNVRKYFKDDDKKKTRNTFPQAFVYVRDTLFGTLCSSEHGTQWDNTVAFGATFAQRATLALIYMSDLIFA